MRYAYGRPMEFIFIVGIIIAIIGALTIAAVMPQGDARSTADKPIGTAAPPPVAQVTSVPVWPPDHHSGQHGDHALHRTRSRRLYLPDD